MDFNFYLFASPLPRDFTFYPFDANAAKIDSFKKYESQRSEKVQRVIRYSGTQITYSYLRYDLLPASDEKSGAFFGMAVVFNGSYCTDIEALYLLLEAVFTKFLLDSEEYRLLQETGGQIRFTVNNPEEATGKIKTIEKIIRKNIDNCFKDDFSPMDNAYEEQIRRMVEKVKAEARMDITLEKKDVPAKKELPPPAPLVLQAPEQVCERMPLPADLAALKEAEPVVNFPENRTVWQPKIRTKKRNKGKKKPVPGKNTAKEPAKKEPTPQANELIEEQVNKEATPQAKEATEEPVNKEEEKAKGVDRVKIIKIIGIIEIVAWLSLIAYLTCFLLRT